MTPMIGEDVVVLRYPMLDPEFADETRGFNKMITPVKAMLMEGNGAYLMFKDIDLTGVGGFAIRVAASGRIAATGGTMELRLDSPDGTLVGTPQTIEVKNGSQNYTIPLSGASGMHKVYLVFRNEKAGANQAIAQIYSIDVQAVKK